MAITNETVNSSLGTRHKSVISYPLSEVELQQSVVVI